MKTQSKAWLNRFEAANLLYQLYLKQLDDEGLPDIQPDFYILICENARNSHSPSAISTGKHRGNRLTYGVIPMLKGAKKAALYSKTKLIDFYTGTYAPYLAMAAV